MEIRGQHSLTGDGIQVAREALVPAETSWGGGRRGVSHLPYGSDSKLCEVYIPSVLSCTIFLTKKYVLPWIMATLKFKPLS